jgi:hypothetical protein
MAEERRVDFIIQDADPLVLIIGDDDGPAEFIIEDEDDLLPFEVDGSVIVSEGFPVYGGPVTVVPGPETQVLETQYMTVMDRITVAPIPKNYGLITYNGRTITVS